MLDDTKFTRQQALPRAEPAGAYFTISLLRIVHSY